MKNNEDYITIPAIKRFIKSLNEPSMKLSLTREELMQAIVEYGSQSDENAELVQSWVDNVIHEGIKDIHLFYVDLEASHRIFFKTLEKAKQYLNDFVAEGISHHICANNYDKDFLLIEASLVTTDFGNKVKLVLCKKLHMHDKQKSLTKEIQFPITVEYYVDHAWLLIRAKPRSNIYEYSPDGFSIEKSDQVTTDKLINEAYDIAAEMLGLESIDKKYASNIIKKRIFRLLDRYTSTPDEISTLMKKEEDSISAISENIKSICRVPTAMFQDVDNDVKNIIEKYLSINWEDKMIFSKCREAHPVKLSATDEEESKVEQSAASDGPLQTKALFFDNKKMLYKNQSCDGVVFKWKRGDPTCFSKDTFTVSIFVNTKGVCIFKFMEYTTKEDIENVLYSIINNNHNAESTADQIS